MCLVIAKWDDKSGVMASDGRMMQQPGNIVVADDVFKCHRLGPSLIVGIIGWAHVTDELLVCLQNDLTSYDVGIGTKHFERLLKKYPQAALQAVLMGVRDGIVQAAMWVDSFPTRSFTPVKHARVIALGNSDLAGEATELVRAGTPLHEVFESLEKKYSNINAHVREESIHA
jgi:hypothetical protein